MQSIFSTPLSFFFPIQEITYFLTLSQYFEKLKNKRGSRQLGKSHYEDIRVYMCTIRCTFTYYRYFITWKLLRTVSKSTNKKPEGEREKGQEKGQEKMI